MQGFDNLHNRVLKICSQSLATPFSLLFNFIFSSEEYPTVWRTATVIPLLKTGSQTGSPNLSSNCSVTFSQSFWETFTQTYLQLPTTPLIPNNSGCRKKHSTLNSLLSTCNNLYQAHDSNLSCRILFLDISKACNCVDHKCLLFKIQELGMDGPLLNLWSSYLSQRSQVFLINRTLSDLKYTSCGVPQGSVLGPLLFLICVNDIAKNINASISLFADNTTLYYSAKCPIHLHRVLPQDLSTLCNWWKVWNINFNPSKTAVMTIYNLRNVHPPLFFNNTHLSETDTHKHLVNSAQSCCRFLLQTKQSQ